MILNTETGVERQLQPYDSGYYTFGLLPPDGPGENQVHHIGTGDHENQPGRGEQHPKYRLRFGRTLIPQQRRVDPVIRLSGIRFGMIPDDNLMNRSEFGARLLERRARCEPAKKFGHSMNAAGHMVADR